MPPCCTAACADAKDNILPNHKEFKSNGADGKLAEVSKELWTITDESGTGVDTLTDGTLYELRVSVADDGALDLSEAEKEIIISVVLSK